jgi:hypothetical protein
MVRQGLGFIAGAIVSALLVAGVAVHNERQLRADLVEQTWQANFWQSDAKSWRCAWASGW